eukprot:760327-Hanusia_phi.AAC.14
MPVDSVSGQQRPSQKPRGSGNCPTRIDTCRLISLWIGDASTISYSPWEAKSLVDSACHEDMESHGDVVRWQYNRTDVGEAASEFDVFAMDRRIMDEEIGNWKNQAFLAHYRAGMALKNFRSNTRTYAIDCVSSSANFSPRSFEDERPRRGSWRSKRRLLF